MNKSNKDLPTEASKETMTSVRDRIDAIDDQILLLLKERLLCAKSIGRLKNKVKRAKWDPLRERQIFERLSALNNGAFPTEPLHSIFREIITTCRLSQKAVTVGYLGPEATFSHLAGVKYFGQSAKFIPSETIEDIFHDVEHGRITYGIVPVENSIEGSVTSTLDSFIKYRVKISGEANLAIKHNLVNYSGAMEDIKTVVSHSQPLAQCRQWLRKNLANIPCQTVFSTGVAAQMAQKDHSTAAIASSLAIKTYDLQVVAQGVEDYRGNTTRFLLIGQKSLPKSGKDKTSILLSLPDRPGALNNALNILAEHGINLTKIESRPVKGEVGKYMFFIDILGHIDDKIVSQAADRLREICTSFEWLGSYPQVDETN
ncbi:MAG: prephenate dehydratase [Deltaproteobacteria bacterium]|nr:prephenate dehydratase [Deltaproteobacteria bacterium]